MFDQLPVGADVLANRKAEMKAHPRGRLSRTPGHAAQTFLALLSRLLKVGEKLPPVAPSGDDPDPLLMGTLRRVEERMRGHAEGLNPSLDETQGAMAVLIGSLILVEQRLAGLDGATAAPGLIERMAGQVALDGYLHRREEDFHEALQLLVGRVLSIEARLATIEAPPPKPSKASKS